LCHKIRKMDDLEFRPGRGFNTGIVLRACTALAFTAIFLILASFSPAYGLIALFPGLTALGLLVNYACRRRFRTRLTAQGIESRRYRTIFVPWDTVRNIEIVDFARIANVPVTGSKLTGRPASRRGGVNRKIAVVRIQKPNGHWLELAVPVVTGRQPDPAFSDKVRLIRDHWQAATGQAQMR
jgi:hypothetical protein